MRYKLEPIKDGDRGVVVHTKDATYKNAKIIQMPRWAGDLLQIECNGRAIALNPASSDFISISRLGH